MNDRESRYQELEAIIELQCPGSTENLKTRNRLVFICEAAAVSDLSDEELHFIGALVKVAGKYGCTLVIGPQDRATAYRLKVDP